jgi:hypothetical protein
METLRITAQEYQNKLAQLLANSRNCTVEEWETKTENRKSNFTPNNIRVLILDTDKIILVKHVVQGSEKRVLSISLNGVLDYYQAKGNARCPINRIFEARKLSCLEELYISEELIEKNYINLDSGSFGLNVIPSDTNKKDTESVLGSMRIRCIYAFTRDKTVVHTTSEVKELVEKWATLKGTPFVSPLAGYLRKVVNITSLIYPSRDGLDPHNFKYLLKSNLQPSAYDYDVQDGVLDQYMKKVKKQTILEMNRLFYQGQIETDMHFIHIFSWWGSMLNHLDSKPYYRQLYTEIKRYLQDRPKYQKTARTSETVVKWVGVNALKKQYDRLTPEQIGRKVAAYIRVCNEYHLLLSDTVLDLPRGNTVSHTSYTGLVDVIEVIYHAHYKQYVEDMKDNTYTDSQGNKHTLPDVLSECVTDLHPIMDTVFGHKMGEKPEKKHVVNKYGVVDDPLDVVETKKFTKEEYERFFAYNEGYSYYTTEAYKEYYTALTDAVNAQARNEMNIAREGSPRGFEQKLRARIVSIMAAIEKEEPMPDYWFEDATPEEYSPYNFDLLWAKKENERIKALPKNKKKEKDDAYWKEFTAKVNESIKENRWKYLEEMEGEYVRLAI